jgi:hypothetical protein
MYTVSQAGTQKGDPAEDERTRMAIVDLISMTPVQQQRVVAELQRRNATQPCPRCRNPSFTLVNG